MRLLLVRHGESEWNALGRWQGQADAPLSDVGRTQAAAAAQNLTAIAAIVSSPLSRAAETAAIISSIIGVGPVRIVDHLMERDAGAWSGLTRAEIEESYPGWLDTRADEHAGFAGQVDSNGRRRPPGWESDEDVLARALAAVEEVLRATPSGDVLVVTHGGLIYTLERHLGGPFARLANLDGRWLEHDGERVVLGDRQRLLDHTAAPVTVPDQL